MVVLADSVELTLDPGNTKDADSSKSKPCTLESGTKKVTRGHCGALFQLQTLQGGEVQLGQVCWFGGGKTFSFDATPDPGTLTVGADRLVKDAPARILLLQTDVAPALLEAPRRDLPAGFKADKGVAFILKGGNLQSLRIATENPPPRDKDDLQRCADAIHPDDARTFNVLCFAGSAQQLALIREPTRGTIMRPNQSVLVVLIHPAATGFTVTMDGDYGVFTAGLHDLTPKTSTDKVATAGTEDTAIIADRIVFGPRLPGKAAIHVKPADSASKVPEVVTELLVEETYAGALRIGIGGVFGGAIDRGFALRTAPGSGQQEIVVTNGGDMDAELVLGAAIFLERGGRGYAVPGHNQRVAPFFGIGVLDQSQSSLKVLRSLHLGLEYELNPHFSVAVTAVGRRVTRLSGAELGEPVQMGGTVPTETGFAFGFGVVVNLSPDFFRLAVKSGSSFFGN